MAALSEIEHFGLCRRKKTAQPGAVGRPSAFTPIDAPAIGVATAQTNVPQAMQVARRLKAATARNAPHRWRACAIRGWSETSSRSTRHAIAPPVRCGERSRTRGPPNRPARCVGEAARYPRRSIPGCLIVFPLLITLDDWEKEPLPPLTSPRRLRTDCLWAIALALAVQVTGQRASIRISSFRAHTPRSAARRTQGKSGKLHKCTQLLSAQDYQFLITYFRNIRQRTKIQLIASLPGSRDACQHHFAQDPRRGNPLVLLAVVSCGQRDDELQRGDDEQALAAFALGHPHPL